MWFSCSIICTLARCHILPIFQHNKEHYNPSLRQINYERNWHAETRMSWLQYLVCAKTRSFFLLKQVLTYTMTSTWTRSSSRSGCISFIVSFGISYPTWAQEYVLQPSNNGVQGCIHSRWSHLCSLSSRRYDFMSFYWMRYWYGSWFRLSIGQWTSNGFCWTLAKDKTLEYCIDSRSIYYTCVWWSL